MEELSWPGNEESSSSGKTPQGMETRKYSPRKRISGMATSEALLDERECLEKLLKATGKLVGEERDSTALRARASIRV